jgi:hypothetical protein
VAVPSAPVAVEPVVDTTPVTIDPPIAKEPLTIPGAGPSVPAAIPEPEPPVVVPSTDTVDDDDQPADPHPHGDKGKHFGWVNGPAHAAPNSNAADAPRGGRR